MFFEDVRIKPTKLFLKRFPNVEKNNAKKDFHACLRLNQPPITQISFDGLGLFVLPSFDCLSLTVP